MIPTAQSALPSRDPSAEAAEHGATSWRAELPAKAALDLALAGESSALAKLVSELMPVIHARVGRSLLRRRSQRGAADLRTTLEDIVQEVFVELFRDDGRVLRAWSPERGLTLKSFVGLVAEQRVAALFRSRRRNPWADELSIDEEGCELAEPGEVGPEARMLSRQALERLLDEVRARLTPMGLELFFALIVREESTASVCARTNMSVHAVHAWSSRLRRLVQQIAKDVDEERPRT